MEMEKVFSSDEVGSSSFTRLDMSSFIMCIDKMNFVLNAASIQSYETISVIHFLFFIFQTSHIQLTAKKSEILRESGLFVSIKTENSPSITELITIDLH